MELARRYGREEVCAVGTPRTVLLAVDDPQWLAAAESALASEDFAVLSARDGDAVVRLLGFALPDLAVLDMMLPGLSGFQLARLVKERSNGTVPVVMLSPTPNPAHHDLALAMGADRLLPKPVRPCALVAAARELCPPSREPAPRPAVNIVA